MIVEGPQEDPVTANNIRLAPPVGHLYDYLREAGWIVSLHAGDGR